MRWIVRLAGIILILVVIATTGRAVASTVPPADIVAIDDALPIIARVGETIALVVEGNERNGRGWLADLDPADTLQPNGNSYQDDPAGVAFTYRATTPGTTTVAIRYGGKNALGFVFGGRQPGRTFYVFTITVI